MKKLLVIFLCLFTIASLSFSQRRGRSRPVNEPQTVVPENLPETKWTVDKDHSGILFTIKHLGFNEINGVIQNFDGDLVHQKSDYSDAKISFTASVMSLNTSNEMRDKQLKSPDFFNAPEFPEIKFESTSFKPIGNKKYKLVGKLTIKGVTRSVSFDVEYGGMVTSMGMQKIAFKALTTINRFDYDLAWNQMAGENIPVIDKNVNLELNLEFTKS